MPDNIDFIYPGVLALLALLPVYALLAGRPGLRAAMRFPSTETARHAGAKTRSAAGRFLIALRLLALAALIVACAGPRLSHKHIERKSEGIDIMLVLDLSPSMHAFDMSPPGQEVSRAAAAKNVIAEFVDRRTDDRIGLVTFAARPFLASPLTLNHDWIKDRLAVVDAGVIGNGTAIGDAVAMAADRMKSRTGKGSRIVILLTDGDDNSSRRIKPVPSAEVAAGLGQRVYTIGIGRDEPTPLPLVNPSTGKVEREADGKPVTAFMMPPANYALLGKMATISNGKFYRAKNAYELSRIYDDIGRLETSEVRVVSHVEYTQLFPPFAIAALALLLIEALLAATRYLRIP